MSEVSQILYAITEGDPDAASQLLPLVYDELRQLAAHLLANFSFYRQPSPKMSH
jgi:hypothetical protein